MTDTNRRWLLKERPTGLVDAKNFDWVEEPVPVPADGQIVVRVLYLSCDPTQRGWMSRDTYMPAIKIGEVVRSGGLGRVVATKSDAYQVGDLVTGLVGWQDYAVLQGGGMFAPAKVAPNVSPELAMSTLGLTGLTAYFGFLDVGRPQPGETVVVSGAAGATGSVVAQLAKIKGCRAIGIAGGSEKCEWLLREAGIDAVVDYKSDDVGKKLRELCPKGIDIFFDNVGGEQLDIALAQLALHGRIVICGGISQYNEASSPPGPKNYMNLVVKRARMEGFLVSDFAARFGEAVKALAAWAQEGKIKGRVDVARGLENAPAALRRLFTGENRGKQLVHVAD